MYAIYLRKSRKDNELEQLGEAETLARHEHTLTELAVNRGYKIGKIFREVVSGETLAARPQMQELLTEVEQGIWQGVIVMEVERLARGNSIDQGIVSQAFKYSNTLIITPNKIYNPANEFDEEYFEFGLFMSRREYKTINRRLNAGRIASCREGKYVGSIPPYGYKKVKLQGQKGFTLEPNSEEAEIVRFIFKLYTQDDRIGTRLICKKLDSMGIKTRKGGKWSLPTVRDILKNEVYIGKIVWNRAKTIVTTKNGKIVKTRSRQTEYDVFDGLHPPLIDLDTFNKAQYYMSQNPPSTAKKGILVNPLAGIIICSKCGAKMIKRPSKLTNDYLICPNPDCHGNIGAVFEIVEKNVIEGINIWLKDYVIKTSQEDNKPNKISFDKSVIAQIDKNIKRLNNQLIATYNLLEQGLYSEELFLQRQNNLKSDIDKLNLQREQFQKEYETALQKECLKAKLIPKAQSLVDMYYSFPDACAKNKLLKSIFKEIVYTKENGGRWSPNAIDDFQLEFISRLD